MSDQLPIKPEPMRGQATHHDDRPKLGEWYWLKRWYKKRRKQKDEDEEDRWEEVDEPGKGIVERETLCCITWIYSNSVQFTFYSGGRYESGIQMHNREWLARVRPEPNWKAILDQRIDEKRIELKAAVMALADKCSDVGLISDGRQEASMLPATTRRDPLQAKTALQKFKDEEYPAAKETVEKITEALVGLCKSLTLPQRAQFDLMEGSMTEVNERLFSLELYAGLVEKVKLIKDGAPAPAETPIAIRQMMRFMDEETLIDYVEGGMDWKKIDDFDDWIATPKNRDRILPEPRCIVSFQIRRNPKEYPLPTSMRGFMDQLEDHQANMWTYLVIRNGEKMYRLISETDFRPRLLPFRKEFHKPLSEEVRKSNFGKVPIGEVKDWTEERVVTPDDLDFDEFADKRRKEMRYYNRVVFLIQGLLDRSEVFRPHPPINLSNDDHLLAYVKQVRDEEDGLPSSNPPDWEEYRDKANKTIKRGSWVWCGVRQEVRRVYHNRGSYDRPKYGYDTKDRPRICQVAQVNRERTKVLLRWELGEKIKEERVIDETRPSPKGPGWYYTKRIEHNLGMRYGNQWVPIEKCFAVETYWPGDYKKFLCDAYQKGRYLQWAGPLLDAEKWHRGEWDKNKDTARGKLDPDDCDD